MMYYIESPSNDPHFNLALEQYVFDQLNPEHEYFMLWQNDNTIVVGKHQNTIAEVNQAYVKQHGIQVVRRLSGGGAVYHDLGNINFTFIANNHGETIFDFSTFCRPVMMALASIGVHAEITGRNDMTIDGKKFSGNSQYIKHGRVMHHGTILYDSDLSVVSLALTPSKDKLESKGLKSVSSRVTNVRPYVKKDLSMGEFFQTLRNFMFEECELLSYEITDSDMARICAIKESVYDLWDWNYGASPDYQLHKERRVDGCGKLEIYMDVQQGVLKQLKFYGDYFGNGDSTQLAELLIGSALEEKSIRARLVNVNLSSYFDHMDLDTFCAIMLQ